MVNIFVLYVNFSNSPFIIPLYILLSISLNHFLLLLYTHSSFIFTTYFMKVNMFQCNNIAFDINFFHELCAFALKFIIFAWISIFIWLILFILNGMLHLTWAPSMNYIIGRLCPLFLMCYTSYSWACMCSLWIS